MVVTIHEALTPENAQNDGYEWVQDLLYDEEAPQEAMQDIFELLQNDTYRMGQPASPMANTLYVGLYKKVLRTPQR